MNTLLSIVTFPIFFALWLYCKCVDYILIPGHMLLLIQIVRFKPPMKLVLWLGYPSMYLYNSQIITYGILLGNKDLWEPWILLLGDLF